MDRDEPKPAWSSFWAPPADVPGLVLNHLKHKDKKGLRATSPLSRTVVNAGVTKVIIREDNDLLRLAEIQLHERFPNLASIELQDIDTSDAFQAMENPGCKQVVQSIVDFVSTTLSKLPNLTSVDLTSCRELDTAGAAQALASCTNLQELRMLIGIDATNATLKRLAQVTSLTSLMLMTMCWQSDASASLQHLSSLQKLQSLEYSSMHGITDGIIAAVAQLTGLTTLQLDPCQDVQGSTLSQLSALSNLQQLGLPDLSVDQHLTALQSLTRLTSLEIHGTSITDDCKGILELPALQELSAERIDLQAAPTSTMFSVLKSLSLTSFTPTVARMLPLPELQHLDFFDTPKPEQEQGEAQAGVLPMQPVLVAAIASQTSLTSLRTTGLSGGHARTDEDIIAMVAPLKQLQELALCFDKAGSGSIAAFQAIAALPKLREVTIQRVTDTQHLALLQRCAKLQRLSVSSMKMETGTLASLVCKPGMQEVCARMVYGLDMKVLRAVADSVGVELVVSGGAAEEEGEEEEEEEEEEWMEDPPEWMEEEEEEEEEEE